MYGILARIRQYWNNSLQREKMHEESERNEEKKYRADPDPGRLCADRHDMRCAVYEIPEQNGNGRNVEQGEGLIH